MEFKKVNEFIYLSNCLNYQIRIESKGKKNTYTCYRFNKQIISSWENICYQERPYMLYQEALTRVIKIHAESPELATRADPDIIVKATREIYEAEMYKITGMLPCTRRQD